MSKKKITLKNKDNVTTSTDDSSDNKKKRPTSQSRKVNKVVYVRRGRTCPKHPGRKFKPTQIEVSQTIFDLVFTTRGIKNRLLSTLARREIVRLAVLNITRHRFESLAPEQGMNMALWHG
jgi:hypothetical protein